MFDEKSFIVAVEESFRMYKERGARSTEKLKPLHKYIAGVLKSIWGNGFEVHYMGQDTKELKVTGKYYPKKIDITITRNDKPVFCLGIKFVISSLSSNIYNYFEQMMGETANIQTKRIPYAQVIIFQHKTPKEDPSKGKNIAKIKLQKLRDQDIKKYMTLINDPKKQYCPHSIGIPVIDIAWTKTRNKVSMTDVKKAFSEDIAEALKTKLSLQHLFREIKKYKKEKYPSKRNG